MMSLRVLSSAIPRWFLSLVLVAGMALLGCSDEPGDDSPIPDDDDSGISADDDDTGDDDTGDDDTGDDDTGDDDTGDDDTTPPPAADCNVQSVVDSSCAEVVWRQPSIAVAMSSCPEGDYVFENAVGWSLFLAKCGGVASDPLGTHDWTQEAMVVTIREGTACFPLSSVLWFANCGDGHHFGHAFELCGDCETTQLVVNFVAVPAGRTPIQFHECLPDTLNCP